MKIKEIIGIDVSKLTMDVFIYSTKDKACFDNTMEGLKEMIKWVFSTSTYCKEETFFVYEHTGIYAEHLTNLLADQKLFYSVISGLEIKKSSGIVRGKDDWIDAKRIALYGYRIKEELKPGESVDPVIKKLKVLACLRKRMIRERAGYIASLKEQKRVFDDQEYSSVFKAQERMIDILSKEIKDIEQQMGQLIEQDSLLKKMYHLITSIKGIGPVTAISIIIHTEKFTRFKTWRKFASYCGIAPFPYRSGTSIRGRTRVSHLANKEIKTLLNMCAISAIQCNPEMKLYYQRRIEQGKHKMSTINIIRNKLVARIFAVVNRGTDYVDVLKYVC